MAGSLVAVGVRGLPGLGTDGMTTHGLSFAAPADESEELARAELYGLLANLWLAPPDAALLEQFKVAVTQAPEAGG